MSRVFVSGGAGFIGSHITDYLISEGHEVLVLDNLQGGYRDNVNPKSNFIQGEICNQHLVNDTFHAFKPDYVIHAAAFASENLSNNCPAYTANNICVGTSNLIASSVNTEVKCFVNLSSIAVYGHQQPPFSEDAMPLPMDAYGAAKAYTEALCRAAKHSFDLDYIIFRPHNVIGKNQNLADKTRNVVSIFIRQALEGKPLTIFDDGLQTRAFSPISQVAPIIASSIENKNAYNQVFNIGGDKEYTVLDIAKMVCAATGAPENVNFLPARKEAKHAFSNHEKLRKYFTEPSSKTVEETIAEMVDEARKQDMNPMQELPPIEINKNIPDVWK